MANNDTTTAREGSAPATVQDRSSRHYISSGLLAVANPKLSTIVAEEHGRAVAAGEDDWWHGLSAVADLNVWLDGDVWRWAVYEVADGRTVTGRAQALGLV